MFKILRSVSDAYITNRYINGISQVGSNLGGAGSLDLFKLYGITTTKSGTSETPNLELSRLLIKFDLGPLRQLVSSGQVDPTNPSFTCRLQLSDVYGGQPTPDNFNVTVHPLSRSFDEGRGRDVVLYSDYDACNWLTSSWASGAWFVSGCSGAGDDSAPCDYLTASHGVSMVTTQFFQTGEEDLNIDVTAAVSGTLVGGNPDCGFLITYDASLETDQHTYFVKRFASRTCYNEDLRPRLVIGFDDSVIDDTGDMYLDTDSTIFLRNYSRSVPTNLTSGTTAITGQGCLQLQLVTQVSGGLRSLYFTGSQHYSGLNPQVGIYSASINIPDDASLREQMDFSGSITVIPVWGSLDGSVSYITGSSFKVRPPQRGGVIAGAQTLRITTVGLGDRLTATAFPVVRINIFDDSSPYVASAARLPILLPGEVIRDVYYQIRDAVTNRVIIPFDTVGNSTRISSDPDGMFFRLDASNLTAGRSYTIDALIKSGDDVRIFESVSPQFKVASTA
jgi:hypothetical protein